MTTLNTVQKFALADTYIAPENVRKATVHDHDGLVALAGSIRHFGRLLEPLKGYIDADGKAAIWDGGRRYSALSLIADDGDGVGRVITDAIDVYVTTQAEAAEASLATFVREDMHPADQFLAYNAKFDAGMSPDQIAAAFAVESKTVSQLLRFRGLAPEIMGAFKDGAFGLDVALAFTLSDDFARQWDVFLHLVDVPAGKLPTAREVRDLMQAGSVLGNNKLARFVGREAYVEAGGTFLIDLFSDRAADERWADQGLLNLLASKKMLALEAELKAEGWGTVIVSESSYGWQGSHVRMSPLGVAKKGKPRPFSAEQMAGGIAFIVSGHSGVEIERGFTRPAKAATSASAQPKPDQAMYGFGHKGHHILTQVATDITKVALANDPAAAADALLVSLAWSVLRKPEYGSGAHFMASNLMIEPRFTSAPVDREPVMGIDLLADDLKAWSDRLPLSMVAFCDAVAALSMADKLILQAHCYASTLDGVEGQIGAGTADRRRHLGWMAKHAKVAVRGAFVPGEAFLKGGSREALFEATGDMCNGATGRADAKKGDLVKNVARLAAENVWSPKLLTTFMDVKDAEPATDQPNSTDFDDEDDIETSEDV